MQIFALVAVSTVLLMSQSASAATSEQLVLMQSHPADFQFEGYSWSRFEEQFKKRYGSHREREHRRVIFDANMKTIREHNGAQQLTGADWQMAPNEYADLTHDEFMSQMGLNKPLEMSPRFFGASHRQTNVTRKADLPQEVDWRKTAVTSVLDQGPCGSCWSFSTAGAIEGAWAIKTGELVQVSEQQMVDCSWSYGNQGCNGGLMEPTYQWAIDNGGVCTSKAYPYTATSRSKCQHNCEQKVKIDNYVAVTQNSEDALLSAVAQQPVAVAVDATVWQFYHRGVLNSCSRRPQLNHGVLLVGYKQGEYLTIKNSWASSWGENGYIRIAIGDEKRGGMCGVMSMSSYPTIA